MSVFVCQYLRGEIILVRHSCGYLSAITSCVRYIDYELLTKLTALERTFLGYLRTSLALSITGIMIAQLLRLDSLLSQPSKPTPNHAIGGVPLAAAFIIGSIVTVLTGAIRFWRQQVAMAEGKVWAGGPELLFVWGTFVAVSQNISCSNFTLFSETECSG
jgi:uncharacterized membrane protein YidH (DUF202 family)